MIDLFLEAGAEILQIFGLIDDFINSFRLNLTFSQEIGKVHSFSKQCFAPSRASSVLLHLVLLSADLQADLTRHQQKSAIKLSQLKIVQNTALKTNQLYM